MRVTRHSRISHSCWLQQLTTHRQRVDGILEAIFRAASTGAKGDGIVAVLPVESVFRIRDRAAADPDDPAVL